ncbi:hypothetical protein SPHINGOR109_30372 [Sphingorhabdus sp. 109]|nr:hypothetical protein SPHINGOR109_30372 [Sphingorhabdus sp. 109]
MKLARAKRDEPVQYAIIAKFRTRATSADHS